MLSDPLFWLAALLAIAVAGISKGGFGSGAAFAATPIMAAVAGPGAALAILLPILALMDLSGIWAYRKRLNWPVTRPL
ncbi:MAG: TSUP family transporter, partial [Pseudomonadota bacterium]